jgi:DNA-binding beta-propeller fold protein YncE
LSTILGGGEYAYRVVEGWGKLPAGWEFGDVGGVGIDGQDRVYVFNRGAHPMVVFDREGNFLTSWGEGIYKRAHGVHMGPDETIYLTDDGDHTVRKCTLAGKILLEIGIPGRPSAYMKGEPFNRCTHTALSPAGDIYVSDGYGNARIHKYAPNGKRLFSWGEPGCDPGQFNLPHNIGCDADGWVYVADRENHRVQVFDGKGKYETQWNNIHRPSALYVTPGRCPVCYIGEIGPYLAFNREAPNLGPRLSIVNHEGKLLQRIGVIPSAGLGLGQFLSPHGIALDSRGDIYVGEVSTTAWPSLFPDKPVPKAVRALQKFAKIRV